MRRLPAVFALCGALCVQLAGAGAAPGLSSRALYQGRDLAATLDLRSVLKGLLSEHLAVPVDSALDQLVGPVFYRSLILDETVDDALVAAVVDAVIRGD